MTPQNNTLRRASAAIWILVAVLLVGCTIPPAVVVPPIEPPVAPVVVPKRPPVIGLALGGGAARGFAHVGVIQVLEEAGIRPNLVVGTSAGSVVATLYCAPKIVAVDFEVVGNLGRQFFKRGGNWRRRRILWNDCEFRISSH